MVNKLTLPAKQNDVVNKVNEIIDDIPTNYVTTDTAQDVIGQKTIVGQTILKSSESASSGRNTVNGFALQDETGALIGRITTSTAGLNFHSTGGFYFRTIKSAGSVDSAGMSLTKTKLAPALPVTTKKMDLGSTDTQWNDLYLYGKIYHGRSDTELTLPTKAGTMALTSDINNPTITFTQGGTTKGTITLNQSGDQTIDLDAGGGSNVDNLSITKNTDDELQAIGVIDNNGGNALKTWTGTLAQYNAIVTKDSNTLYNITDDNTAVAYQAYTKSEVDNLISAIYPVGSIYIGTQSICPLANLINGSTWVKVSEGRVLQGSDSNYNAGTTIEAGLPNITGSMSSPKQLKANYNLSTAKGAFSSGGQYGSSNSIIGPSTSTPTYQALVNFSAQSSNSIYGNSSTVQPPAFVVNIWQRTA